MKVLQLTNNHILEVPVDSFMPLGTKTLLYPNTCCDCCETFVVSYAGSDTVSLKKSGAYNITYVGSLVADGNGDIQLDIIKNGEVIHTVKTKGDSSDPVNIAMSFSVYIPCNCPACLTNIPAYIQIKNAGVALTCGTSNLIITKY